MKLREHTTKGRSLLRARAIAAGAAVLMAIPTGAFAQDKTPPAAGERRKPVMIEGKTHLPLRVVSRPFSHIYKGPDEASGIAKENVEPFSVFFVFGKPEAGGETGDADGFYEVAASMRAETFGWMRAQDVIEWKNTLCVGYVHPDDANPVLMFRDLAGLEAVSGADLAARADKAKGLYDKIDAGAIEAGFPVISMSPRRAVDITEKFYLMPIIEHKDVVYETETGGRWPAKLLKVAAATKAEAGRGATLIANPGTREVLTTGSTGGETELGEIKFDVVFVMDLTRSMQPFVDGALAFVKSAAETLGNNAEVKDRVRFGFVGYRDSAEISGIEFNTKNYTPSLQALSDFATTLGGVKATQTDSVDFEEDVIAGVHDAITQTGWTEGAVRMIVLVGDAPAHELGHKWNSTGMGADELRALADEEKVAIYSVHIKDPKFPKYHEAGTTQFTKLANNPGVTTGGGSSYYPTSTRDMAKFKEDTDAVVAAITKPIIDSIVLTPPEPTPDPGPGDEPAPGPIATEFVRAAVVQWLGKEQGVEAPKDITAWVTDKDLIDPSAPALQVHVLLTKNQADSLHTALHAVLTAGANSLLSNADFFAELQATSAAAMVRPDQIRNAKRLADTGIVPQFLEDLPYDSPVTKLTDDFWANADVTWQDNFLNIIESKKEYFGILLKTDGWQALAEGADEDQKVKPVPLSRLP